MSVKPSPIFDYEFEGDTFDAMTHEDWVRAILMDMYTAFSLADRAILDRESAFLSSMRKYAESFVVHHNLVTPRDTP